MEYGAFKGIQFLLFFGTAMGVGVWQLISVRRELRRDAEREKAKG